MTDLIQTIVISAAGQAPGIVLAYLLGRHHARKEKL